jgi:hypothetical protein
LRLAEWTHLQQALSESPGAHDASTDFEPRVAGEHGDSPRVLSDMKFKVAAPPQGSYGATALAKAPPELSAVASFASSAHVIVPVAQGGANQSKSSSGLKRFVTPAQASKQQTATSFTSVTIAYRSLPPLLWARVLEFLPMQVVLRTVAMLNRDFAKGVEFDLQPLRQSFELRSCGRPNIVEEAIEHCGTFISYHHLMRHLLLLIIDVYQACIRPCRCRDCPSQVCLPFIPQSSVQHFYDNCSFDSVRWRARFACRSRRSNSAQYVCFTII